MENSQPKIEITENGPYIVYGKLPVVKSIMVPDEKGNAIDWKPGENLSAEDEEYLCRCGNSGNKPYCDNSHLRIPFDGTETAGFESFSQTAETIEGPQLILKDGKSLCASARFCNLGGGIRELVQKSDDPEARALAIRSALNCSSGRLVLIDKATGETIEEKVEPQVIIAEDPGRNVSGPIYLKGGIEVIASNGKSYEVRNRVTLCRCGHFANKPFCDGSHIKVGFNDGDSELKK